MCRTSSNCRLALHVTTIPNGIMYIVNAIPHICGSSTVRPNKIYSMRGSFAEFIRRNCWKIYQILSSRIITINTPRHLTQIPVKKAPSAYIFNVSSSPSKYAHRRFVREAMQHERNTYSNAKYFSAESANLWIRFHFMSLFLFSRVSLSGIWCRADFFRNFSFWCHFGVRKWADAASLGRRLAKYMVSSSLTRLSH